MKLWFLTHALMRNHLWHNYTVSSLVPNSRDLELPLIWPPRLKIARNDENWFKNYLLELTAIFLCNLEEKLNFQTPRFQDFYFGFL